MDSQGAPAGGEVCPCLAGRSQGGQWSTGALGGGRGGGSGAPPGKAGKAGRPACLPQSLVGRKVSRALSRGEGGIARSVRPEPRRPPPTNPQPPACQCFPPGQSDPPPVTVLPIPVPLNPCQHQQAHMPHTCDSLDAPHCPPPMLVAPPTNHPCVCWQALRPAIALISSCSWAEPLLVASMPLMARETERRAARQAGRKMQAVCVCGGRPGGTSAG